MKCESCGMAVMGDGIYRYNPGGGTHVCRAEDELKVEYSGKCPKCGEIHDNPANVYHAGPIGFEADFDKIMVLEDDFKSGYECDDCKKSGKIKCPDCDDGSSRLNHDVQCKTCHQTMLIDCPACKGKGEFLVIPDSSQRRPTTGTVVSVGESVKKRKLGHRVMYPSFCGEVMDLKGVDAAGKEISIVVRFIAEKETIARMSGTMELRRVSKQQFNVGG
jgi:Chaperonin 10 Kd subunit